MQEAQHDVHTRRDLSRWLREVGAKALIDGDTRPNTRRPARKRGEVLFYVRDEHGGVHYCEMNANPMVDPSYLRELRFFRDDDIYVYHRICVCETEARQLAEMVKQDLLRAGGTDLEKGGDS